MENFRFFLLATSCTFCFGYGDAIEIRISSSNEVCPDGWMKFHGSCYLIREEPDTIYGAQIACKKYGSHLVLIESELENKFLQSELKHRKGDHYRISELYAFEEFRDFHSIPDYINLTHACVVFSSAHNYQWVFNECLGKSKSICEKEATQCPTCGVIPLEWISRIFPGGKRDQYGKYTEKTEDYEMEDNGEEIE